MAKDMSRFDASVTQDIGKHYSLAAEELLQAYQRNKEASRHHESGAFKAALHHSKLSKHHAFNAHAHLNEALSLNERLDGLDFSTSTHLAASGAAPAQ